jgi:hypothetical protein
MYNRDKKRIEEEEEEGEQQQENNQESHFTSSDENDYDRHHHRLGEENVKTKDSSASFVPFNIPKPKNLTKFKNELEEVVSIQVGIRSHQRSALLPISAFRIKSRQQLEAERASFLQSRKHVDEGLRHVERAFDQYLLQSRQVELAKMQEEEEKQRIHRLSSPMQQNMMISSSSSSPFSVPRKLLITSSCEPKSIFSLEQYMEQFPREPRKHAALTARPEDDEFTNDEEFQSSNKHFIQLPLLKNKMDENEQDGFFMTETSLQNVKNNSYKKSTKNYGVAATPQPTRKQFLPPLVTKSPSPKKNENRIYGNRNQRALWGVSPSFEVAASSISKKLQLKPTLQ